MKTILNRPLRLLLHLASCLPGIARRATTGFLQSCLILLPLCASAATNIAPTVAVISAAMRPGTTLMDITYKVTDPDDPTVKVRALAFVDGTRSFANVIRPVTWVEGTEANLGDAITSNVNHTLTWDVKADWSIDLGNIKVEILARDGRGLLPLEWITIPAAGGNPAVTISKNVPTNAQVLDGLFWLYADGDSELVLTNGNLIGALGGGMFNGEVLASGASLSFYAPTVFLYRRMNLARAIFSEKDIAIIARLGISDNSAIVAALRPWNNTESGSDPTAVLTTVINSRWIKNTYADGAITMVDCAYNLMWIYNAGANGKLQQIPAIDYCANLVYAGHDDWYCPAAEQLNTIRAWQFGHFPNAAVGMYASTTGSYTVNPSVPTSTWNNSWPAYVWPVRAMK